MDQAKTNLPYLPTISKSNQNLWRIRTHITGALIHTKAKKGKTAMVFIDLLQWAHGSNLTTNILLHCLSTVTKLPEVLYLQLDNSFRENKKRICFGFICPVC